MQLYGCGENSSGYLGEPRSCARRSVSWPHDCKHNNFGADCPYCPLWVMKLKPILAARSTIRILGCDHGSTFVEINDRQATTKLKHLSDDPFGDDDLAEVAKACCHQEIKQAVVLSGPSKAAFLLEDGSLLTLDHRDDHEGDGRRVVVTIHRPRNQERAILHIAVKRVAMHNPALVSGAVAIVPHADPRTVLSFDSWAPMLRWLTGNGTVEDGHEHIPTYTATFSSPITKLTGEFAALTADGEVFTWGKELPADQQPPPPPDEDEEEFDEAWDEFVLFGKPIVKWPSRLPRRLDYTPRKLPLPVPIEKLSTGACYGVAVSKSRRLFVWGYRSTASKGPEIRDVTIPSSRRPES